MDFSDAVLYLLAYYQRAFALCKLIVARGFKKWPKVQEIAQFGHTAQK